MEYSMTQIVVSDRLAKAIDEANATFGRAKELIMSAYRIALEEGYTPKAAANLLLSKITVFKKSTIYTCLPDESKDKHAQTLGKAKAQLFPEETNVPKLEQKSEKTTNYQKDSNVPKLEQRYQNDSDRAPENMSSLKEQNKTLKVRLDVNKHWGKLFAAKQNGVEAILEIQGTQVLSVKGVNEA